MCWITSKTVVIETLTGLLAPTVRSACRQLQADMGGGILARQALPVDPYIGDRAEGVERADFNRAGGTLLAPRAGLEFVIGAVATLAGNSSKRGPGLRPGVIHLGDFFPVSEGGCWQDASDGPGKPSGTRRGIRPVGKSYGWGVPRAPATNYGARH